MVLLLLFFFFHLFLPFVASVGDFRLYAAEPTDCVRCSELCVLARCCHQEFVDSLMSWIPCSWYTYMYTVGSVVVLLNRVLRISCSWVVNMVSFFFVPLSI